MLPRKTLLFWKIVPLHLNALRAFSVLLLIFGFAINCAADVVLLRSKQSYLTEENAIHAVTAFYGVKLEVVAIGSQADVYRAMAQVKQSKTQAVMLSQDLQSMLNQRAFQSALARPNGAHIPILVYGVSPSGDSGNLERWSGGAVRRCVALAREYHPQVLEIGARTDITRTLSGSKLPAVISPTCSMQFGSAPATQVVISATEGRDAESVVMLRTQSNSGELFFVPKLQWLDTSWIGEPNTLAEAFSSMAPFILFVSHAAGDTAWHTDGHYANLTIDDPWLTEPYGHLRYSALSAEMEKHNFHTTVAFIPWNFDRSDTDVVSLIRQHPEHFSVCVHGNNHAHREFGDYKSNSLIKQTADIKQGIARMERFHALTGVPYDRFMVFPHAVAPESTLAALRRYGFEGTANFSNVPMGAKFPTDPTFVLRPYTTAFGGLLSFYRYPANGEILSVEVAIHSFLGNPLLFYGHESLFETGATAFNAYADFVNRIQPDTRWASLGEIARHSYLIRRRTDGDFDIQMFSSEVDVVNSYGEDHKFYIQLNSDVSPATASVTIDETPWDFGKSAEPSVLRLPIAANKIKRIRVEYHNDLDLHGEDIRRRDLYANALRMISDFRDLYLVRSSWGQAVTKAYYQHKWDAVELYLESKWWAAVIVILFLVGIRRMRRRDKVRAAGRTQQ